MATQTTLPAIVVPDGAVCERCQTELVERLSSLSGVVGVALEAQRPSLVVTYDPSIVPPEELERRAQQVRDEVESRFAHELLLIVGMDCGDCAATIEGSVRALDGVEMVEVNFASSRMRVEYESARVSHAEIVRRVGSVGYEVEEQPPSPALAMASGLVRSVFVVNGMDCEDCAVTIERNVQAMAKVRSAEVSFAAGRLVVEHDPDLSPGEISAVVDRTGYSAMPEVARAAQAPFWRRHRRVPFTAASSLFLLAGVIVSGLGLPELMAQALFGMAIAVGGYHIARAGIFNLLYTRTADISLLLAVAAVGAVALGDWAEAATVVFLFSVGSLIESYTMDRARNSVQALMALAPEIARVRRNDQDLTLPVAAVLVGDTVGVRPGERIPMDGVVTLGSSSVDQAPVTGESAPVEKVEGDTVYAGTINQLGYLEVRVTKPYQETTLAKIVHMVEEAQTRRAPSQRFVDRFASRYTPAVIALAGLVAVVPPLFFAQPWDTWIYRALVMLLVSCPCALVVSTPVAVVSAIANAARAGALIKGGAYLEAAGALRVIAFDKTGTLTVGRPEITDIIPLQGWTRDAVLEIAAALEERSEHPLAAAIRRGYANSGASNPLPRIAEFKAITGKGVSAQVDEAIYHLGSPRLVKDLKIEVGLAQEQVKRLQEEGKTVLLLASPRSVIGLLALADQMRPQARDAIRDLHAAGIKRVVMLTGDNAQTARAIAAQVGIDDYRAELLPDAKVEAVRGLREAYGDVGMIGDGVNDAPALASATVGIAMGAAGTDVALETADIALMADDLTRVAHVIRLSRATLATMRTNIAFSIATKLVFMVLVIPGWTTLWLAILADVGTSLIVTFYSLRLLGYRQGELELGQPAAIPEASHDHSAHDHAAHDHASHDYAAHDHAAHAPASHEHTNHNHAEEDADGHAHHGGSASKVTNRPSTK